MCCRSTVLAACLVLAGAIHASAQEHHPLRLPTIVFVAADSSDIATTFYGLSHGGHETNPLYVRLHDDPGAVTLAATMVDMTGVWALNRYVGQHHPKIAATMLYIAAVCETWQVIQNARLNYSGYRPH